MLHDSFFLPTYAYTEVIHKLRSKAKSQAWQHLDIYTAAFI